jgi:hypothetical protein
MPTDEQIKQGIEQRTNAVILLIRRHEDEAIRQTLRLLEELREEVTARIDANESEFTVARMRALQRAIERRILEFQEEMVRSLNQSFRTSFNLGIQLADVPMVALTLSTLEIDRATLRRAVAFSADLIAGISSDIRNRINAILRRAVLGVLTPQEAMNEVGRSLTTPGAFRTVSARSEAIVRTEVLRIQSEATQDRMIENRKSMVRVGYMLRKSWLSTIDTRTRFAHLLALGQVRDVDQPFNVGGEELMFPRDPSGSAVNTINCRCTSSPVVTRL